MKLFTFIATSSLPLALASQHLQHKHGHFAVGKVIETSSGFIAGHPAASNCEVSEYLGIPYAQPPVGHLRFAAPLKYTGISRINASTFVGSPYPFISLTIADV